LAHEATLGAEPLDDALTDGEGGAGSLHPRAKKTGSNRKE
jgi:hypothetical protein